MSKTDKFCALRQHVVGLTRKQALYKGTTMKFDNCDVQNDSEDHYNHHQEYQTNHALFRGVEPVRELTPDALLNSESHGDLSLHSATSA